MPKTDIDYSNTIIYKITCKDQEIKDVYVGHTTNFVQRKHAHKQCCNNPKSSDCMLYKTIREKGGWSNWKMEIINFFNCHDHYEARKKEQEYFVSLNANLNSIEPMPKPKAKHVVVKPIKIKQICDVCNINCNTLKGLEHHNETSKHKKLLAKFSDKMVTENLPKNAAKYSCDLCDFKCCKLSNWKTHVTTNKHKIVTNGDSLVTENATPYICNTCSKVYCSRNGLWVHSKKCNKHEENAADDPEPDTSLIVQLMKQNDEFKNLIIEQNKTIVESHSQMIEMCKHTASSITNSTVNSHNKTFNLQVFLNEDCKDAMNITDFVDSIKFQLADLEHMGKVGYVDGISNIILKNLKALDIHKRPVHCTDQKRETIYIKDGGVWSKEEEDNKNVRKLIKKVAFRNSKCLSLFKEKYPDCITSESKYSDTYSKIVIEAMGGGSKCNDYDSENKIIRKIAKAMIIDKSM